MDAHLVLLTAIPQERLRQHGLMDYMLSATLDAKFDLARQAAAYLPDGQKTLWLKIIQWIQEKNFNLVLDELLKHPQDFHHQQFLTWLSHHYRELQPSSDADQLSKRLSQHHRLYLELHEDAKTIESGQATALHDIHRSLCLAFFEQWAELIQKQANYSLLLDTCQKLFIPHAQAFDPYFSWQTYLG